MRISAIPIGNKFKHNNVEYIKTNYNRGSVIINNKKVYKSFKKHLEVEVGQIIY